MYLLKSTNPTIGCARSWADSCPAPSRPLSSFPSCPPLIGDMSIYSGNAYCCDSSPCSRRDLCGVVSGSLDLSLRKNLNFKMSISWNELAPLVNRLPIDTKEVGKDLDSLGPVLVKNGENIVSPHHRSLIAFVDGIDGHASSVSTPTYPCQHANIFLCKHADMKTLHQRIRWALDKEKLKPIDLARQAGIHHASISQWMSEDYRGTISAINLIKAAERLKVRPRWLLTGEGLWQPDVSETIDSEAKPVVDVALKLPKVVRDHFVVLMQHFVSTNSRDRMFSAGNEEGKKEKLEHVGGSDGERDHLPKGQKARQRKAQSG